MKKHFIRLLVGGTATAVTIFAMMLLMRFPHLLVGVCLTALAYIIGTIITMDKNP